MRRREFLTRHAVFGAASAAGLLPGLARALAVSMEPDDAQALSPAQSAIFRAWFVCIVDAQLHRGPTPRWTQRDCAGLVRFAAMEAMRKHDDRWLKANGMLGESDVRRLPPELALNDGQRALAQRWTRFDGTVGAYASAIALVQDNSRHVSRDVNQALTGDLLFFDQGDDQHLMIWLDRYIAYHTGTVTPTDNGLRAVAVSDLMQWKDSRWRPLNDNPNFAGIFRLAFLRP
jgi:hypothetical protein